VVVGTAVGCQTLQAEDYTKVAEDLGPDIVISLGDIPDTRVLGAKRATRAIDRTSQWLIDHIAARRNTTHKAQTVQPKLFASVLPGPCERQFYYMDYLEEHLEEVSGLAIFGSDSLEDLPESLRKLPRLGFTDPKGPHAILNQVFQGMDILTLPFVTNATDAGIAFTFGFPVIAPVGTAADCDDDPWPLAIDMWSSAHAVNTAPVQKDCACYTCRHHHRAYVQHLLIAKEMLGWVLIQIHNHHVIHTLFSGIRQSIAQGVFEHEIDKFTRRYEQELPTQTGKGPKYVTASYLYHLLFSVLTKPDCEYIKLQETRNGEWNFGSARVARELQHSLTSRL
jgi:queuine tRNA-ribosyltransferase